MAAGLRLEEGLARVAGNGDRQLGRTVTLRRRIARPPVVGRPDTALPEAAPVSRPFDLVVTRREPTVLSVRGPWTPPPSTC